MAVYKVIQDVEAEDKLLGPLTFKGFIYAIIALICAYINFRLVLLGSPIKWAFLPVFLIPMLLFGVLASPLGRDQPTEVWLLSRIKFFLKAHLRIWDQSGIEELVTITVPKKFEHHLTKDISQNEVQSRLKTLASTLDTRGWAIKNVDLNLNTAPAQQAATGSESDRLVANAGYTQNAPVLDIHAADDILDEQSNPTAQKFVSLMQTADDERKSNVLRTMKGVSKKKGAEPDNSVELTKRLAKARAGFGKGNHKNEAYLSRRATRSARTAAKTVEAPTPVTPERQAVNMELAQSGSAFSVATLSQLANRQPGATQNGPSEITISLH